MALFVKRLNKFMSKKSYGRKGQYSKKKIPSSTKSVLSVVKKVTSLSIVQTRKMTRTRRARKMMTRKRRDSSRGRKMVKPILLSGIPMQAPMMMMTSHPKVLPESPSRRLLHSSPHHIALWQKVAKRYYKMVNLMNSLMMILLKCSLMPMNL